MLALEYRMPRSRAPPTNRTEGTVPVQNGGSGVAPLPSLVTCGDPIALESLPVRRMGLFRVPGDDQAVCSRAAGRIYGASGSSQWVDPESLRGSAQCSGGSILASTSAWTLSRYSRLLPDSSSSGLSLAKSNDPFPNPEVVTRMPFEAPSLWTLPKRSRTALTGIVFL